jgi:2-amino-4-hydroxy-6-hydroxymethyldihydropteridine diphosphokinase
VARTPAARAHLALGSNLGDRLAHLQSALDGLAEHTQVEISAVSRVYETDPVGGPVQDDYLNAVVEIRTTLAPEDLLDLAQLLEAVAQRARKERWGPRTLDVDILLYDDLQQDDERLTIPHPRMSERGFVLAPLHDVAPDLVEVPVGGWPGVRPVHDATLRAE